MNRVNDNFNKMSLHTSLALQQHWWKGRETIKESCGLFQYNTLRKKIYFNQQQSFVKLFSACLVCITVL